MINGMNYQTKILVIDDNKLFGEIIKSVLTVQGYDVCYVNNGASGIQKAFEYNPDLILCDIIMDPIDGFHVYNVLKESTLLDTVPFIFITGNFELPEIRFGMDLGADDYLVKPFSNASLFHAIEKRLAKFKKLKDSGMRVFKALFRLSPNGIFLFDSHTVFDANPTMIKYFNLDQNNISSYSLDSFINTGSNTIIKEKTARCSNGLLDSFHEQVTLASNNGKKMEVSLYVSAYEKYSGYTLMIGLIIFNTVKNEENDSFVSDVLKTLKQENIVVTDALGAKLTEVFHQKGVNLEKQNQGFFSKRETEVLCLSMEGLPTKLIADQLSISDRTVEKHRANLMEKTNSKNIIEVIVFALRNNLIEV